MTVSILFSTPIMSIPREYSVRKNTDELVRRIGHASRNAAAMGSFLSRERTDLSAKKAIIQCGLQTASRNSWVIKYRRQFPYSTRSMLKYVTQAVPSTRSSPMGAFTIMKTRAPQVTSALTITWTNHGSRQERWLSLRRRTVSRYERRSRWEFLGSSTSLPSASALSRFASLSSPMCWSPNIRM